jgi:hypothetical protein
MKDSEFKTMVMIAVNKLLAQGEQSSDAIGGCEYRSSEGLCCIVGFMMDDKTAGKADDLENSTIKDLIREGVWGEDLTNDQVNQLHVLQECHDFVDKIKPFNEEFIDAVKAEKSLTWVGDYIGARE